MPSIYQTKSSEETIELGMQLAKHLQPGISVLLFGDLGSGKTQFVKGIAKGLGITENIKSPTFAYLNKYPVEGGNLYHFDLYRLKHGEGFESIGLEETMHDPHAINIIEWADRMAGRHPEAYIRIDFRSLADHHEIAIHFEDPEIVPEALVEKYYEDWATPMHVRSHCRAVKDLCFQIGQAYIENNVLINLDLLNTAALLHDVTRICDFTELDRNKFHEEITEEKWNKWVDLRNRYQGLHHADIAYKAFLDEGYAKTAEVIRLHNSLSILEEPEKLEDFEAGILFYADKRVKHDEVVSLAERFEDGRIRHGKYDEPKTRSKFEEVEKRTFKLEEKLFELINLNPDNLT